MTPAFEEPSVRETLLVGGDVRPWNEYESPFAAHRSGLQRPGRALGRASPSSPPIRFFIVDGVRKAASGYEIVSGDPLVRACRMIKSPAELALMQTPNDVTIAALRYVHDRSSTGMSGRISHAHEWPPPWRSAARPSFRSCC